MKDDILGSWKDIVSHYKKQDNCKHEFVEQMSEGNFPEPMMVCKKCWKVKDK